MSTIKSETIAEVPTLYVVKAELQIEKKAPVIFFLHGFTSAKEHNLHVAYLLSERGFRVLLPDALHHGERENEIAGGDRNLAFWKIILKSIKELGIIKTVLEERHLIDVEKVGGIGTLMGEITMYGALTQYKSIQTAVSFMGTAYYKTFANGLLTKGEKNGMTIEEKVKEEMFKPIKPFDLFVQLDKLDRWPLSIWHGTEDQVGPFPFSEKLYAELISNYEDTQDKLQFLAEELPGHKVSRRAVLRSVDWFEHHLCKVLS